ncbi:hypothetical protein DFS34DRAFT_692508 [Phlyctochytrium arcticum]|nr:hypothetical protein DFS34DRAFT_692508 [Phlyctochytrium arcticum]
MEIVYEYLLPIASVPWEKSEKMWSAWRSAKTPKFQILVSDGPNILLHSVNMQTPPQALPTRAEKDTNNASSSSSSDSEITVGIGNMFASPKYRSDFRAELQDDILYHEHSYLLVTAPPAGVKTSMIDLLERELESVLVSELGGPPTNAELAMDYLSRKFRAKYILVDDAHEWFHTTLVEDLTTGHGKARVVFFASCPLEAFGKATPAVVGRMAWDEFKLHEAEQIQFSDCIMSWAKA